MEDTLENQTPTILGAFMDLVNFLRDQKEHEVKTFDIVDIFRSFESHLVVYID